MHLGYVAVGLGLVGACWSVGVVFGVGRLESCSRGCPLPMFLVGLCFAWRLARVPGLLRGWSLGVVLGSLVAYLMGGGSFGLHNGVSGSLGCWWPAFGRCERGACRGFVNVGRVVLDSGFGKHVLLRRVVWGASWCVGVGGVFVIAVVRVWRCVFGACRGW